MPRSRVNGRRSPRAYCLRLLALLGTAAGVTPAAAAPAVASINLCADQLVLSLADPEQIRTVSWLAADPEESMLAERARPYPLNYGSAEEILAYRPDVVIGGSYTNAFTRRLLADLGYAIVAVEPAATLADIERNLMQVAEAVEQVERGRAAVAGLRRRIAALERSRPELPVAAVVVRPGGFTVGRGMLADQLMTLAGLRNVAAERGLDRWGSLSMETLILAAPELLILSDYRRGEHALANAVFAHPALAEIGAALPTVSIAARYWACGLPESLESAGLIRQALPQAGRRAAR